MTDVTIETITVETPPDTDPDLSHLGEFRDDPGPAERTIDLTGPNREGVTRRASRYFVAANVETAEQARENYRRFQSFNHGDVSMIGVCAVARIRVGGVAQSIRSGGLYGIESDASGEHAEKVAREEVDQLREILAALGVDVPDDVTVEWDRTALWVGEID